MGVAKCSKGGLVEHDKLDWELKATKMQGSQFRNDLVHVDLNPQNLNSRQRSVCTCMARKRIDIVGNKLNFVKFALYILVTCCYSH